MNQLVTVVLTHGRLCSHRHLVMPGDTLLSQLRDRGRFLLVSHGKRPGRLLNMIQYTGKISATKNDLSPNVSRAEALKLLISLLNQKIDSS